jgi:hypothetical protein
MPRQPVVSVLIVAQRGEATRPRAIRRPLAQACTPCQAIVALDNGTDGLTALARAGLCDDRLQPGRAPWGEAELACLSKEPARAA